jgi:hypothetical protein
MQPKHTTQISPKAKATKKAHTIDHKNPITFITCKKTNKSKNNNPFRSSDHHQLLKALPYFAFFIAFLTC